MEPEQKTKLLLVDDERLLLDLYRSHFEKANFAVYSCSSAEDALKVLRYGYRPDVILFDLNMPDMSGYDFLKVVKKENLGAPKYVAVALTNQGHDAEKQYTSELGADAHILKSNYIPAQIVTYVEEVMKKKGVEKR